LMFLLATLWCCRALRPWPRSKRSSPCRSCSYSGCSWPSRRWWHHPSSHSHPNSHPNSHSHLHLNSHFHLHLNSHLHLHLNSHFHLPLHLNSHSQGRPDLAFFKQLPGLIWREWLRLLCGGSKHRRRIGGWCGTLSGDAGRPHSCWSPGTAVGQAGGRGRPGCCRVWRAGRRVGGIAGARGRRAGCQRGPGPCCARVGNSHPGLPGLSRARGRVCSH
jgi:hypothetical protein